MPYKQRGPHFMDCDEKQKLFSKVETIKRHAQLVSTWIHDEKRTEGGPRSGSRVRPKTAKRTMNIPDSMSNILSVTSIPNMAESFKDHQDNILFNDLDVTKSLDPTTLDKGKYSQQSTTINGTLIVSRPLSGVVSKRSGNKTRVVSPKGLLSPKLSLKHTLMHP